MKIEWDGDVFQFFFILLFLRIYIKRMYILKGVWLRHLPMKLIALYYFIRILSCSERLCSLHSLKFLRFNWISESRTTWCGLTSSRRPDTSAGAFQTELSCAPIKKTKNYNLYFTLSGKILCICVREMLPLMENEDLIGFINNFKHFPGNVSENSISNHLPFH